ncbi:histidinol-phosphate transaminase [Lysobacter pythonis]|uniref:Histidinol-phosphate aminotransferase n=1 Tax=Solilutibacter pythonis TaxID=2483112 RepID=A0A3M2HQX7_9GAMM|nr:histidinol-phosphate transaminase [Lysobacter pythonis]RMH90755.1 histidinol-phosphate transaminase [Lysobacter pythonis]
MSGAEALLREDLRGFTGYRSARSDDLRGAIWLNANESAHANAADASGRCRRYPDPQPWALRARLAELYGVAEAQVLVGRGSDEGIDLLLRAFCMPGRGRIVIAPPVFGMYAVCARLHGAEVIEIPLAENAAGFAPDFSALADAALAHDARLLFLCNPGNPTGELLPLNAIERLAERLSGRCLLVVDEAYGEYAMQASAASLIARHANLVVLRTLSKAHALAAARIGSVLADAGVIACLRRAQAPYPLPTPCVELALSALDTAALADTDTHVREARIERARLVGLLGALAGVRRVYPSQANFLLVRFEDAQSALARLLEAGIVVRDMRTMPQLGDALRISLGTPAHNDAVLAALASLEAA